MTQPWLSLTMTRAGPYVLRLSCEDRTANRRKDPPPRSWPGATDTSLRASAIALAGTLILLAAETLLKRSRAWSGSNGTVAEKGRARRPHRAAVLDREHVERFTGTVRPTLGFYSVADEPVIEEVIFRGYLIVGLPAVADEPSRPRAIAWAGAIWRIGRFCAAPPSSPAPGRGGLRPDR